MANYIFGLHSVAALLEKQPERLLGLYVQKERQDKKILALIELAKELDITIHFSTRQALDNITKEANHQGIVADCRPARVYTEADLEKMIRTTTTPPFLLILDGIQDPHNLGACFRTAEAAGVDAIIAPKDKSASITSVVAKVASGATETLPFVQVTNLARTLTMLKALGIWIYGADGEAEQSLFQATLTGPIAIVLGAEGSGMRRLTREHCDVLLKIPMFGSVSSLNISVAAGIFLFSVVAQRK